MNKMAQELQDKIFREMTVEQKFEVWVGLFQLAKDLTKNKKSYGTNRPESASQKHR